MGADMGVHLARPGRSLLLAATMAAASLGGTGCGAGLPSGAPVLTQPEGAASLQSTDHGVVWSLQQADSHPAVLRSSDSGRTWLVALSRRRISARVMTSYFLGPTYAWVVQAHRRRSGTSEVTTVLGTASSGNTWWRSRPLPKDATHSRLPPHDQVYFADPVHGWLLSTATRLSAPSLARPGQHAREVMRLWRTTDGGRTWTALPSRGLPLQNLPVLRAGDGTGCPEQPAVTFSNASAGWLTEGACGSGQAGPTVWRTRTAGRRWVPFPLAVPPGGWADGSGLAARRTGADVGPARVISSRVSAIVLVPVAVGPRIVIERSTDGGQTWTIAAQVSTGTIAGTPADCFDPLNESQWVISAPGELIETADGGQTWTYHSSDLIQPGAPVSFSSLNYGFLQVAGLTSAMLTTDGGSTWTAQPAPGPGATS